MVSAVLERPAWRWGGARELLPWIGMGACLALLAGHLAFDFVNGRRRAEASEGLTKAAQAAPADAKAEASPTTVALTAAKLKAANIGTAAARYDEVPRELGVSGRIEVNADRRIDIRPRAAGVVREVYATLGQGVKKGQPLVMIDSPEVGTARLNLRARQRELSTARIENRWKTDVASAVELLIPEIRKGTDPSVIQKDFADRPLGMYRGTLLQAYADFDIAAHEEEKTAGLRSEQVIGEHPAVVARHTREGLQAKLYAAIEQVKFDAAQEKRLSDQRERLAESEVVDAAQRLRILGVSEDVRALLDHPERADALAIDEDVTAYKLVAPFDGTVIAKAAVASQKAELNEVLYAVADLSTVWVTANVPESDVASLPAVEGGAIRLSSAAYGGRTFQAKLLSVGAIVDPQTRTVALLAGADNREGLLRPGMFVRIELDSPTRERALTVPRAALVEIDGKPGVFVPSEGPAAGTAAPGGDPGAAFAFRPVVPGRELGDRVILSGGIKEGDLVVSAGAYQLKSELLLGRDTGDED
ncbi:Cobalt-zinc-cadmium resistance protein CzcB [Aquisphaera giovannonii]|uniref:Cobalt-zinc-cadmium resistance protein CzcB n=1 Tax=Aquisphaera giovannonii TaxID=406548 RepID=A0A5B9WDD1_9BACT|nr:efflux RND transporter periplasmic adaptor subunit [Aquisphaera giovannonii]QEH38527.1 Cobalt-zinc-cadmium resistance protein CzcB [Aquisphaera giovannonii]